MSVIYQESIIQTLGVIIDIQVYNHKIKSYLKRNLLILENSTLEIFWIYGNIALIYSVHVNL